MIVHAGYEKNGNTYANVTFYVDSLKDIKNNQWKFMKDMAKKNPTCVLSITDVNKSAVYRKNQMIAFIDVLLGSK